MISSGNDIFFLTFSDESETTKLNKVKDHKAKTIHSFTKEELKTLGCNWLDTETITLLAVNSTHLYYGVNFNDVKEMNIYSMGVDGKEPLLYRNAYDVEGDYVYYLKSSEYDRYGESPETYQYGRSKTSEFK